MDELAFLFSWQNTPFLLALATSLILALIQVLGGGGGDEASPELEATGPELEATGPEFEADLPDAVADAPGTASGGILGLFGVGKLPLMLILMALLLSLGAVGLILNSLIMLILGSYPAWMFLVVLLVSLGAVLPLTRSIAFNLARLAPRSSTAIAHTDLVGRVGLAVSPISRTYGRVSVRDHHGTLHTVFAITEQDEALPIQSEVALLSYDPARRHFVVRLLRR
ncbi:MAG: hypothetical protein AB4911_08645 [Oscillochloridaceae bacterium umkhey_bin13]